MDHTHHTGGDPSAGAGVYIEEQVRLSFPLGKHATVFQSEVFAIDQSISYLTGRGVKRKKIVIFSDSQAAIRALTKLTADTDTVNECKHRIHRLSMNNDLHIMWVPGHIGVEGNEVADELARSGSNQRFYGPEPCLGIAKATVYRAIAVRTQELASSKWQNLATCRQTKIFFPLWNDKRKHYLMKLCKPRLRSAIRAITGHCRLNKHMTVMRLSVDPTCPWCAGIEESAMHTILECRNFADLRHRIFGLRHIPAQHAKNLDIGRLIRLILQMERI